MQGSLAHAAPEREKTYGKGTDDDRPFIVLAETKPIYSAESALLLVVRAIPSAPSLFTTVVATVLERMQFGILFFLSALVLVNFLGMA